MITRKGVILFSRLIGGWTSLNKKRTKRLSIEFMIVWKISQRSLFEVILKEVLHAGQ